MSRPFMSTSEGDGKRRLNLGKTHHLAVDSFMSMFDPADMSGLLRHVVHDVTTGPNFVGNGIPD